MMMEAIKEIYKPIDGMIYRINRIKNRTIYRIIKIYNKIAGRQKGELYELYDAVSEYGKIYRTRDNKVIAERNPVYALEVWNGELYGDTSDYGKIYRTRDSKVVAEGDS
jgi:hypothetical protein